MDIIFKKNIEKIHARYFTLLQHHTLFSTLQLYLYCTLLDNTFNTSHLTDHADQFVRINTTQSISLFE